MTYRTRLIFHLQGTQIPTFKKPRASRRSFQLQISGKKNFFGGRLSLGLDRTDIVPLSFVDDTIIPSRDATDLVGYLYKHGDRPSLSENPWIISRVNAVTPCFYFRSCWTT